MNGVPSDEQAQSDVKISDSAVDRAVTICLEDRPVTLKDLTGGSPRRLSAHERAQSLQAVADTTAEAVARPLQLSLM